MDTPLNFTLRYADGTNDITDTSGDIAVVGTNGYVWFEPTVREGYRIPTTDGGLTPRTFEYVMENGVLKTEVGGSADVRLWGNDPDWNLARYAYRVRADLTDAAGNALPWPSFEFDAPSEDAIRYLRQEMPRPGQKFGRGRPGFGIASGESDGATLTLILDDGSELPPVTIPEASGALAAAYAMTFGR